MEKKLFVFNIHHCNVFYFHIQRCIHRNRCFSLKNSKHIWFKFLIKLNKLSKIKHITVSYVFWYTKQCHGLTHNITKYAYDFLCKLSAILHLHVFTYFLGSGLTFNFQLCFSSRIWLNLKLCRLRNMHFVKKSLQNFSRNDLQVVVEQSCNIFFVVKCLAFKASFSKILLEYH